MCSSMHFVCWQRELRREEIDDVGQYKTQIPIPALGNYRKCGEELRGIVGEMKENYFKAEISL